MPFSQFLTNADAFPQFIVSKIVTHSNGRIDKIPCNPQGITANHKDPVNWLTLSEAEDRVASLNALGGKYAVGFSITKECGIFFLDIDKCLIDGKWSPLAETLCIEAGLSFKEISNSGKGLHIMGRYTGQLVHKNKNTPLGLELYTHDRFVMFGTAQQGDWNTDCTVFINKVVTQYFSDAALVTNSRVISVVDISDEEVLARCRAKDSPSVVFGKGVTFDDLYNANEEVLINRYIGQSEGKLYDASGADMALGNMLVVHTQDVDQIIRIMRGSSLMREKWDTNTTYLSRTVNNVLRDRQAMPFSHNQSTKSQAGSQAVVGDMPPEFDGCFYVVSEREVYSTRYGLLNQDGFNVCYGSPYLKEQPYKTFKGHAKEAGRIIGQLGFRPDLAPGEITEREGFTSVNTYKPLSIKTSQGSMEPFWRFFKAMIPDERDQQILMSYACVAAQKPGVKSQWCPIIQGVQGCGKSLFADFVAYACGQKYTHRAKGDEFENRFNIQWFGKTLILAEDLKLKDSRLEEVLKPLITSKLLAFEGKGTNVQMNDFPANFILTLNDFELIQKRADSRRLAVFMSGLQTPEDLIAAGLTPTQFRMTVDWRDNGGYEIVAHYLLNTPPHPEFDFSRDCVTAPHTSTTDLAIESSRQNIELIILEEIAQERIGFRGGWISSTALNDFISMQRIRHLMPDNRRGQILKDLGYVYHPGLRDGQAIRNVLPENKRSRLYIKKGHQALLITDREVIVKAYEDAQK